MLARPTKDSRDPSLRRILASLEEALVTRARFGALGRLQACGASSLRSTIVSSALLRTREGIPPFAQRNPDSRSAR